MRFYNATVVYFDPWRLLVEIRMMYLEVQWVKRRVQEMNNLNYGPLHLLA